MLEQFIRGVTKTNILRNERGNILILSVFLILFIMILVAGMAEFGRVMIVREQLQTAADAASLSAAASGTHRQVEIKVITDRGSRLICDKDGNCSCSRCGTVTRGPFKGDETDLIDQGGWSDYCVETCSGCPGSDCWFELVSRDLMYDNKWMGKKMSSGELNNALDENTYYAKESLSWAVDRRNERKVKSMTKNKTIEQIASMVRGPIQWRQAWLIDAGHHPNCNYNCNQYKCKYTDEVLFGKWYEYEECLRKTYDCNRAAYSANECYDSYSDRLKRIVDRTLTRNGKMVATNNKPIDPSGILTDTIRDQFFEINLPKHATKASIDLRSKTYDMSDTNSPYYPSVVVYATAEVEELFKQWFGDKNWKTTVCAQSATFYRDVDSQLEEIGYNRFKSSFPLHDKGKWRKPPKDACIEEYSL